MNEKLFTGKKGSGFKEVVSTVKYDRRRSVKARRYLHGKPV